MIRSALVNATKTKAGIVIGIAHIPQQRPMHGDSAVRIQSALLEPRTAHPRPLFARILAPVWRWL